MGYFKYTSLLIMKKIDLHILMLEDDPFDAELNKEQLSLLEEYNCIVHLVATKESYQLALQESVPEIILCDYNIPNYTGLEALNYLKEINSLIPFIFVTGAMIEEVAADAIKAGAWDYVVKDRLFRLPLAIRSVLKLKQEKEIAAIAEAKANRLLHAIEQTSAQIVITDKEGLIEYVNKKFTEITGYLPQDVIGKSAHILIPDNDFKEKNKNEFQKLIDGEVVRGEILSLRKNGTEFWELVSITPIRNEFNQITNYMGVKEDITLRKKMEEDITEARDKAQQSDILKNAFLQNMSHEIRTPLNAIVGFSSLLSEPESLNAKSIKDYTEIITRSSNQLLAIVTDVLTIASIQTGHETLNMKSFDLNDLMNTLYVTVLEEATVKNIELREPKTEKKNTFIISDEIKLKQILLNLINNAIKFTHEGYVEFGYRIENKEIEFFVKDTGIGIDEKNHEEIFENFRQVDPSIHIEYGGTGLGLAISKSYSQMLNGSIRIKSKPNIGTTFFVTIPYNPESEIVDEVHSDAIELPDCPLKILIAEDEYYNFMLLKTLFSENKYTLYHAKNGLEAYNLFIENPGIDIVIMDIKMPIMDGKKAFLEIRKKSKDVPILALTAYSLINDKNQLLEMGFTDYISKPVDHNELFDKMNKALLIKT